MADSLKIGNLTLNDSQHAPHNSTGRAAYIPPHLRQQQRNVASMNVDGAPAGPQQSAAAPWASG
jgi:ATP-dependent RNA helicase DDX3X